MSLSVLVFGWWVRASKVFGRFGRLILILSLPNATYTRHTAALHGRRRRGRAAEETAARGTGVGHRARGAAGVAEPGAGAHAPAGGLGV